MKQNIILKKRNQNEVNVFKKRKISWLKKNKIMKMNRI